MAIAAYVDSLDKPGATAEELARWLCEHNRALLVRQRQALLDDVARYLRPTYPMIRFMHSSAIVTSPPEAGRPPAGSDPSQPQTTVEVTIWVTAVGLDRNQQPVTFESPHRPWRFTLARSVDGWSICQVQRPDWCHHYQKC